MVREHGLMLPLVHPDANRVGAFGRRETVEEVTSGEGSEERGASACGGPLGGGYGTGRPLRRVQAIGGRLRVFLGILDPYLPGGGLWDVEKFPRDLFSFPVGWAGASGWAGG